MGTILELRSVTKEYATQRAVHEVSLEVPQGAFFSLLGPSGCGKTSVLRMVAGFDIPSSGEVWLDGARIDALPPYRRNVNTVFQSYALFPHLNVRDNVAFGLRGRADARKRVGEALEMVRLAAKADRQPHQLSGGERQRVALARALVMQPAVLLLDEPLSALDPLLRKQVRGELKELQRRVGITFLFVTHDQEEALSLSDSIAVMNAGRVEQVGSPREVYERPASRFVADFMGAINWIGSVGVRPEHVRVCTDGRRGQVTGVTYLGSAVHVDVLLETGETVIAQVAPGSEPQVGAAVCLAWNTEQQVICEPR